MPDVIFLIPVILLVAGIGLWVWNQRTRRRAEQKAFIYMPLEGEGFQITGGVFFTGSDETALIIPSDSQVEIRDCWFSGPNVGWWRRWRYVRAARKRQLRAAE